MSRSRSFVVVWLMVAMFISGWVLASGSRPRYSPGGDPTDAVVHAQQPDGSFVRARLKVFRTCRNSDCHDVGVPNEENRTWCIMVGEMTYYAEPVPTSATR